MTSVEVTEIKRVEEKCRNSEEEISLDAIKVNSKERQTERESESLADDEVV